MWWLMWVVEALGLMAAGWIVIRVASRLLIAFSNWADRNIARVSSAPTLLDTVCPADVHNVFPEDDE